MQAIELATLQMRPGHLRVFSGRVTIGPDADLPLAIADLFAPPFAAPGLTLAFDLVDRESGEAARDLPPGTPGYRDLLLLQSGEWRPDRLRRVSLYHGPLGSRRIAVRVHQELIPLPDRPGVLITFALESLGGLQASLAWRPCLTVSRLARIPPSAWDWFPPGQGPAAEACPAGSAREVTPFLFEGQGAWLHLRCDATEEARLFPIEAGSGGLRRTSFLLELASAPPADRSPRCSSAEIREAAHRAEGAAARRQDVAAETLPTFHASDPRLERFYERSLTTAILNRWEHPDFALDPHLAAAGLDGGGVCTYPWDLAYLSSFLPLMLTRPELQDILARCFAMRPEDHFAFDPLNGEGLGRSYALNAWSITRLVRDLVAFHGSEALGSEAASWLDRLERLADTGASSPWPPLLDYGDTTHLLELRTGGYEHVVPSPNAERIAIFEILARLRERFGLTGAERLRARARGVRSALLRHLWDEERGWFRCGRPDGTFEPVDSVQILTLIGLGVLPGPIVRALCSRVEPGDFLGPYGLHSISPRDRRHYEAGDVDWGGGGSYVGQAPLLAFDLYRAGERRRAEDVLERILWWAEAWPYYPQSIRADRQDYCDFDRPNCIAALSGAQALIFGLAGFHWRLDGRLSIRPHPHPCGEYRVGNVRWNGRRLDLLVDGERFWLRTDGKETHVGRVSR